MFNYLNEILIQFLKIIFNYTWIIILIIPFYGIWHKVDREYFIDCIKDLWNNNKTKNGLLGFIIVVPIIFILHGYKTLYDHHRIWFGKL